MPDEPSPDDRFERQRRTWSDKFSDALRGTRRAMRGQSSFTVHLFVGALVVTAAFTLRLPRVELCLLLLCITVVLVTEMLNTALEHLSRAIDRRYHPEIAAALDVSSGAVLLAAFGAASVGAIVFVHRFGVLLDWWPSG